MRSDLKTFQKLFCNQECLIHLSSHNTIQGKKKKEILTDLTVNRATKAIHA